MSDRSRLQKLSAAYRQTMETLKTRIQAAEAEGLPMVRHGIEDAAETAAGVQQLTREELDLLKAYVRRDLADAGHYLATSGEDLRAWFRFDLELVEARLLAWFGAAADRTRLEYQQFAESLEQASHYHCGEITGPGTLVCERCGTALSFKEPQPIPACAACGHTVFVRAGDGEEA